MTQLRLLSEICKVETHPAYDVSRKTPNSYRISMSLFATLALTTSLMKPHIMILGTYHMGNPGLDLANVKADDVLVPKRQAEIAEVIKVLKKFKPTKIAIEAPLNSVSIQQQYQDYRVGKFELRRNESDQFGFRLAKEMGHAKIYPVDVKGEFPFDRVVALAAQTGKQADIDVAMKQMQGEVAKIDRSLQTGTILNTLRMMNAKSAVESGQGLYMKLAKFATLDNFAGPDLLAEWYKRNIRISTNIHALVDTPNERILVIYGAGHLYWLQRNVLDSPDLILDRFY